MWGIICKMLLWLTCYWASSHIISYILHDCRLLQVWEKDEPAPAPAEGEEEGSAAANGSGASGGSREQMEVVISDVTDANALYVQVADEPRVTWVAEQLAELSLASAPPPAVS